MNPMDQKIPVVLHHQQDPHGPNTKREGRQGDHDTQPAVES